MVQRITMLDAYSDEQLKEMGVERPARRQAPTTPRARWEWEGRTTMHAEHKRGVDLAETRDDLALRLASRGVALVYAFELPPGPSRQRLAGRVAAVAACITAAVLCPAWAAGWVLGAVAALAVAREAPP